MSLEKFYSFRKLVAGDGHQDEIEEVFDLMRKGDERIVLDPKYKKSTFVLGNTGSGKSTLILFVATDNKTLRSQESSPGSGDFYIVDDEEKIGSGINSQTSIPELIVNKEIQAAFYDCPGFNDTRTSVNEIATSYFIKKIFDFADEIKIVLTVNHASVRIGVDDRTDFMNLMRNVTTLVKDVDKYQDSIGLVITKVENKYVKDKGNLILVSDEKTLESAEKFLQQAKEGIKKKLELIKGDVKEETFLHSASNLIDKFLVKDAAGRFQKIGLFRRPDEAGPLLEVKLLQERKPALKQLLHETLKFTKKDSADIGYTISDRAKLDVNKIVEKLKLNVSTEVDMVVAELEKNYQGISEKIQKVLESFREDKNAETDLTRAKDLLAQRNTSFDAIHKLNSDVVKATQIGEIAKAVKTCGTKAGIDLEGSIANLTTQDRYFEFLQTVNGGLSIGDYSMNFASILVTLTATKNEIEKDTENIAEKVQQRIKSNLSDIAKLLKEYFDAEVESHGIDELASELDKQQSLMMILVEKNKKINNAQDLAKEISNMTSMSDIDSDEIRSRTLAVLNNGNYLTIMSIFKNGISVWSPDWTKAFVELPQYMNVDTKWYGFLQRLYKKLSTYDYIANRSKYNVANIEEWGSDGRPQGIKINKANYAKFLLKVDEADETIKKLNFDEKKERELNHIFDLTIKQWPSINLNDKGTLTVQGVFVKFSDFISRLNDGKNVNSLNVHATDTIFVDADLIKEGTRLQVNIVAPRWEIIDNRSINLAGKEAEPQGSQASAGKHPSSNGEDGKPGLAGGPGGSFLGIGYEFKALGNLTINVNGGRGGKAQQGGNGVNGEDGVDASKSEKFQRIMYDQDMYMYDRIFEYYRYLGTNGGVGGKGGDGGAGGLGAAPGNTKIIRTNGSNYLPTIKADKGLDGEGANGGAGAKGGKNGNNFIATFVDIYDHEEDGDDYWMDERTESNESRAANGSNGTKNANTSGRMDPQKPGDLNPGEALNAFETYLRDALDDRFLKEALKKFLDQLHLSKGIYSSSVYDSKLLLANVSNLEDQLPMLNDKLTNDEIIYLYQSIMQRTIAYSKSLNLKQVKDKEEQKKSLNHIQTILLGKIQSRVDSFNK